jgi:hypothetical protein
MTDETTPQADADGDYNDEWLSTERLLEIVEIASECEESNERAAYAINELSTENLLLRNQVAVSTGVFAAMASVLDGVIYAADRTNNTKLISLIEGLLRREGLLAAGQPLLEPKPETSKLIVPDTKTTKTITHKGRITEVS